MYTTSTGKGGWKLRNRRRKMEDGKMEDGRWKEGRGKREDIGRLIQLTKIEPFMPGF
jgi:hypothetical protein